MSTFKNIYTRKEFVKNTGLAVASIALMPIGNLFAFGETKTKIVLIGTGLRGQNHLDLLQRRND